MNIPYHGLFHFLLDNPLFTPSPPGAVFTSIERVAALLLVGLGMLALWMLFSGLLPKVYSA
jgi:hypothetical protein